MSWLSIILFVITNLPTLLRLVREIIDLINQIKDPKEKALARSELGLAVKVARQGDKRPLRVLFERLQQRADRGAKE